MALTKNKIKFIKSLEQKKFRQKHNCFIVEGEKMVLELLASNCKVIELYQTIDFQSKNYFKNPITITNEELRKITLLKTPNNVLAIAEIFTSNIKTPQNELSLVLDDIKDPGNLGTIIRTANWFGIKQIYCSMETADVYNPKVVQSTMGALFRTNITYCNIEQLITQAKEQKIPVYGTLLSGSNIYEHKLSNSGYIVLGNESKGISPNIEALIDHKIKIPSYAAHDEQMESLNVAIANAIVLAEFKRQIG